MVSAVDFDNDYSPPNATAEECNPPAALAMPDNPLALNVEAGLIRACKFCYGLIEGADQISSNSDPLVTTSLYSASAAETTMQRLCPGAFKSGEESESYAEQSLLAFGYVDSWLREALATSQSSDTALSALGKLRALSFGEFLDFLCDLKAIDQISYAEDIGVHLATISAKAQFDPESFDLDDKSDPRFHARILKMLARTYLVDLSVAQGDPRYLCYLVTDSEGQKRKLARGALEEYQKRADNLSSSLPPGAEFERYQEGISMAKRILAEFPYVEPPPKIGSSHLD